VFQKGHLTYT